MLRQASDTVVLSVFSLLYSSAVLALKVRAKLTMPLSTPDRTMLLKPRGLHDKSAAQLEAR